MLRSVRQSVDMAIVGAGIAGLAAAQKCRRLGIDNVQVLEAGDQPGGCIQTDRATGIALGAVALHSNLLQPELTLLGLEAAAYREAAGVYLYEQPEAELTRDQHGPGSVQEALRTIQTITRERRLPSAMSVEQFLEDHLNRYDSRAAKCVGVHPELIANALQAECGAHPSVMSIRTLAEASAFSDTNYQILGGFSQLPLRIAEALPIRYRSPVETIDWSSSGVTLVTSEGVIEAQKAIVAVPLGVLQHGQPRFLRPIPPEISNAIERIGTAIVCKMIVTLERVAWPSDMTLIRTDIPEAPLWWPNESVPPSLTCFVGGRPSAKLQRLPSQEAAARIVGHLSGILRRDVSGLVRNVHREAWSNNPHVLGGYSYLPIGIANEREALGRVIDGRIALANEAVLSELYPDQSSTVIGAFFSGEQAAVRLHSA